VPSESLPAERKGSSEAARAAAPARRRRSSGSSRIWVGVGGDPLPARTDEGGGGWEEDFSFAASELRSTSHSWRWAVAGIVLGSRGGKGGYLS
jgi:hypothetical protein